MASLLDKIKPFRNRIICLIFLLIISKKSFILFLGWRNCAMTISEQIKILCVKCNLSEAELARRLGKSPQSFNAKMKRESFTIADLDEIADAAGVVFERSFVMMNVDRI